MENFNIEDWKLEISSGHVGYRNIHTQKWIYDLEFQDLVKKQDIILLNKSTDKFIVKFLSQYSKVESVGKYEKEIKICKDFFEYLFSDEKCQNIIHSLNELAVNYDKYEYGLPDHEENLMKKMIEIIKSEIKK